MTTALSLNNNQYIIADQRLHVSRHEVLLGCMAFSQRFIIIIYQVELGD